MSLNTYSEALDIVKNRRLDAKANQDARIREINIRIPEIAEITTMISRTSIDIIDVISKNHNVREELEKLEQRNLQAQEMIRSLLVKNGYPEDYLELKYTCSRCSDTGFIDGRRCSCLEEAAGKLAITRLNESSPLKLSTFETFSLEYYRGVSTEKDSDCYSTMAKNLEICRNYVSTFSKHSRNLFITGGTGLGKTHLSLAIAERLLQKDWNVVYGSAINLIDRIEREHFGRADDGSDTLSVLFNADLLILDDLGSEYDKQFTTATMYNIINTRLNMNVPTIISTNLSPAQIEKRYEPRIVSRIFSNYDYLRFTGNDVRQLKKAEELRNR